MGGKLDTRINPTRTDTLTRRWPLEWYQNFVVSTVPDFKAGHGRRVYPASTEVMMLWAYFVRNFWSGGELFGKVLRDDGVDPIHYPFVNTFFSVSAVPAEFYIDTVDQVFRHSALAEGQLTWRGNRVALENITDTALLTVEGEYDDISGIGQTEVAHRLCREIPSGRRAHFMSRGTGHLGLFYGGMWRAQVLPRLASFIQTECWLSSDGSCDFWSVIGSGFVDKDNSLNGVCLRLARTIRRCIFDQARLRGPAAVRRFRGASKRPHRRVQCGQVRRCGSVDGTEPDNLRA